jgi:hypothetical protein
MTPAAEVAIDVLVLLRRGCVAPALAQLERLPAMIRDELLNAAAAGYEAGRQAMAAEIAAKPKRLRQPAVRPHEWLQTKVADPELRARAKRVLRINDDRLLDRVLAGSV